MNRGRCVYCGYSLLASWRDCRDGYCSQDCAEAMVWWTVYVDNRAGY